MSNTIKTRVLLHAAKIKDIGTEEFLKYPVEQRMWAIFEANPGVVFDSQEDLAKACRCRQGTISKILSVATTCITYVDKKPMRVACSYGKYFLDRGEAWEKDMIQKFAKAKLFRDDHCRVIGGGMFIYTINDNKMQLAKELFEAYVPKNMLYCISCLDNAIIIVLEEGKDESWRKFTAKLRGLHKAIAESIEAMAIGQGDIEAAEKDKAEKNRPQKANK